jgi:transcriptional regulator with XRE-family HTH domain
MVLLRKVIGDALRARRLAQHRTLREVSTAANVSLGYLSEIERGHKEASSELLAAICDALGAPLSQMLGEVSATFALAEQMDEAFAQSVTMPRRELALPAESRRSAGLSTASLSTAGLLTGDEPSDVALVGAASVSTLSGTPSVSTLSGDPSGADLSGVEQAASVAVTDGDVTVQVHSDGPLRATLTTRRNTPGPRSIEPLLVG